MNKDEEVSSDDLKFGEFEEQLLFAHRRECDCGLFIGGAPFDVQDTAFAKLGVHHDVAHRDVGV